MTVDMLNNKKLNTIVTKLFIRSRELKISLVFITKSYFAMPENVRLSSTFIIFTNFIKKIPNKRELQ